MKDKKPAQYRGMTVTEVNPEGPNVTLHILMPSGEQIPVESKNLILNEVGFNAMTGQGLETSGVQFLRTRIKSSF